MISKENKKFRKMFIVTEYAALINSLPATGDFCHRQITFVNSLDPDQADKMFGLIWIQTVWHPMVLKNQHSKS